MLVLLAVVLLGGSGGRAWAQEPRAADWELTGLRDSVLRLFTPASGAFLALTRERLLRSDDAGATWTTLALPFAVPGARGLRATVDPTDQSVLYVGGADGLFKSVDAAGTWTRLTYPELPNSVAREAVDRLAVSAADPRVVYLALTGNESISAHFRFLRSLDGGASWEPLEEFNNSLCGWGVRVLLAHPTDARRVFRTANCYAGRNLSDALRQSLDQATTWASLFEPRLAFPAALVGGQGAAPTRFYLAANHDSRSGGASLYRTDDDGATWTAILAFQGGGTIGQPEAPNVQIGGLAYDPAAPDRIYVGLNEYASNAGNSTRTGSRVTASADGGQTWMDLGRQDLGTISELALGIDALNLYAATDQGIWRLPLGR